MTCPRSHSLLPQLQIVHTYPFLPFTLWIMIPGSSTDISEDWEKDFDLDMTEEEVQMALSKVDASGELEDVEWEDWE